MNNPKKIYFASDFHLGAPSYKESRKREDLIVQWLDEVKKDALKIYLVGDLFDFWFEYKHTVPKGFVRFLGKLAEITDSGIELHIFTGNHDMWMYDYLSKEINAHIYYQPILVELQGKNFFIGHGDGLGPGDFGYKVIKKIFRNNLSQFLFRWLHPDMGIGLADYFSGKSRISHYQNDQEFLGSEKEWLVQYCKKKIEQNPQINYFVFGHRHLPLQIPVQNAIYINLGDWITHFTYAELINGEIKLEKFK